MLRTRRKPGGIRGIPRGTPLALRGGTGGRGGSFIKQAAILAAASLFVRFIGFLYHIPFTNLIGDIGNSYYNAGFLVYTFVLIMSSHGLPTAISRLVSERLVLHQYLNAHEVFKSALWVALIAGLAGALLLAFGAGALANTVGVPQAELAIRALSPTILVVAVMAVLRGYFQGMNNMVPTAVSQGVEQIFNAIFTVWLASVFFDPQHLEKAAAGGTAGTGFGAAAGFLVVGGLYAIVSKPLRQRARTQGDPYCETRTQLMGRVVRTALPIVIGTAVFSIANFIDMTMIHGRLVDSGAFTAEQANALFGQFSGKYILLTTLPVSLSASLATVSVPSLAGSAATFDTRAVKSKINTSVRAAMMLSIPAAVGLGVLADPILLLLFPNYPEGGVLLKFGAAAVIFLALNQVTTGALQGIGRLRAPVVGAALGALVKIPLNYWLIALPSVNVVGAVLSTIACYLAASGTGLFFLYRYTRILPDLKTALTKPGISAAAMGLACYIAYHGLFLWWGSNTAAVIFSILIGLLTYGGFMVLLRGFSREDAAQLPLPGWLKRGLTL